MTKDSSETQPARYPPLEVLERDFELGHELVRYPNGTCSLREMKSDQTMHSRVGPADESRLIYAEAARVSARFAQRTEITLWDVGMGTAANVAATFDEVFLAADRWDGPRTLHVESFEVDPSGLALALRRIDAFPSLVRWKQPLEALLARGEAEFDLRSPPNEVRVRWRLLTGDFYVRMLEARLPDLIYFDFYAPRSDAPLWTRERFAEIRSRLAGHAVELYTYSAATPTRLALLLAGFYVGYGARTEMKTETTVAATRLDDLREPLTSRWREKLRVSAAVTDEAQRVAGLNHSQWSKLGLPPMTF